MAHIMIDLETLGTHATAPVVSAGLAVFDLVGEDILECHGTQFNLSEQFARGRVPSVGTLAFWLGSNTSPAAKVSLVKAMTRSLNGSLIVQLTELAEYIATWLGKDGCVWGYGADFDIALLGGLFDMYNITRPWSYRSVRCYRTVFNAYGDKVPKYMPEVEHNPISDAVAQARTLQAIASTGAKVGG